MKYFIVKVTSYLPYPIMRQYDIRASGFPIAVARGVRLYRKDPRIARRRMDNINVSATAATIAANHLG